MTVSDFKNKLVHALSTCDKVLGIGQTGDTNAKLVPGYSDIDLFVLCSAIPSEEERREFYLNLTTEPVEPMMNVCSGGIWGYGDVFLINGIEIMPMYFTIEEMDRYLTDTLQRKHIENEGRFYPTGRLASVETINILYEENSVWTSMKKKVKQYPEGLFAKLFRFHIARVIDDEDLGRVVLRKEELFYHQVLENALDHLLQALFAVNHTYFPSRKRTKEYIESFLIKPDFFYEKLMDIIEKSISSATIEESVKGLRNITMELLRIGDGVFKISV